MKAKQIDTKTIPSIARKAPVCFRMLKMPQKMNPMMAKQIIAAIMFPSICINLFLDFD